MSALAKIQNDPPTRALWDPWKVLGMYPKSPDFSCVGVTWGHSRCGWKFWRGKWAAPEADLKLMSTMHPSRISEDILTTLARHSLCADNHQYQAYDKVEMWSALIAEYSKVANEQLAPADELWKVKTELEELRKQVSSPTELASLRGKVVESKSTIQALRESERAKSSEITSLTARLAASNLTILTSKDTETAKTHTIEALKEKCAVENDRIRTINELYEEYKHSNTRLRTERDAKEEDLSRLKQDLWNLEADLEANQRAQRSKGRETENLRQQLHTSNALIGELQAITKDARYLHQKMEDTKRTLTESNRQVSHLQQENQRLKTQKHFRTFRDHVRLLAKQKNYERAAIENQNLLEQASRLAQRLEEADMQLAAQDVSNAIAFFVDSRTLTRPAQRTLSFFRLKNVTKGICAVVSTKPRQLSIRRFSKIGRPAA